ncbi:MAG: ABC transporter permease [Bacteroidales bacterium]|nr:ABC transporter permease [Bacteroidales bacterium]MCI7645935.1 ABC transporter permease [Bacteroidales bacterium]
MTLFAVISREMCRMVRQPLYWFCLVAAPILSVIFFTTLMDSGLPQNLPIGIVDQDNTTTSRSITRNLDAFQAAAVTQCYPSVTEARRAVQQGDIYGFYYIPQGTSRKAQRQEIPTVSFYTNYAYLVAGSLLYRDMRTMSELASGAATRSVLYAKGAREEQAMAFLQPIVIDTYAIGNPWLNYSVYLCNTLIPGVFMIFIFMVTVYGLGIEVKQGTVGSWLAKAKGQIWTAVGGKLLAQTVVFLLVGLFIVWYLYVHLRFPCHAGIGTMMIVMTLGILGAQGLGVFMFAMLPSLRLGLSFASLWGVLSFSICGMSFPVMAMHPALQGLAWLFPLRHYFLLYVNCALDGLPLSNAWPYAVALLAFAVLPMVLMRRLRHVMLYVPYTP